ncbi:copper resistance CopC family protein [Streptomyces sp. NPDC005811]|uniref:copper resistance CopC family protein n=1 Tax=Streptomyces sp. NPDC005811 TaxID=3154565 RepID=UPI0033D6B88E
MPTVRRAAVVIGSFVSLAPALLLGSAGPASAHATMLFTSPAADATVADSPKSLVLVFDRSISPSGSSVHVEPSAAVGTATLGRGGQAVAVPLRGNLAEGVHTIDWQVTARDDVMMGSYRFAVGPRTVVLSSGQSTIAKDAAPTTVLRRRRARRAGRTASCRPRPGRACPKHALPGRAHRYRRRD